VAQIRRHIAVESGHRANGTAVRWVLCGMDTETSACLLSVQTPAHRSFLQSFRPPSSPHGSRSASPGSVHSLNFPTMPAKVRTSPSNLTPPLTSPFSPRGNLQIISFMPFRSFFLEGVEQLGCSASSASKITNIVSHSRFVLTHCRFEHLQCTILQ
jgi:hypothetical protein